MENEFMKERMTFAAMVDGQMKEFEVLFTYEHEETGLNYIVYTDGEEDENGNVQCYASIYTEGEDGAVDLQEVKTDAEWQMLARVLEEAKAEALQALADEDEEEDE